MPVIQWIMRSFPEAPVILQRRVKSEYETVEDHPLPALLDQPNKFYSGVHLWMATCLDWCWWGEAYWRIMASRGGRPAELWWLPPWSIQPQWPADGSQFISHYVYGPEGQSSIELPIEEVVHFRHSLDPHNLRHGLPPLRAILQDIWVDAESNNFVGRHAAQHGHPWADHLAQGRCGPLTRSGSRARQSLHSEPIYRGPARATAGAGLTDRCAKALLLPDRTGYVDAPRYGRRAGLRRAWDSSGRGGVRDWAGND